MDPEQVWSGEEGIPMWRLMIRHPKRSAPQQRVINTWLGSAWPNVPVAMWSAKAGRGKEAVS